MTSSYRDNRQSLNALPAGTVLRDYVIESELGSGGFSIVYLARHHLNPDWLYAIKEFLPGELAVRARDGTTVQPVNTEAEEAFDDGLRRFRDEAEQLRKFRNEPYIVSCLNYFEQNGTAYLVMDHDDGLPLLEHLWRREEAGQPFTEKDLLAVVEPLLEGLTAVHRAGVLHRDIKPGNIFVRRQDDITGRPAHPVLIDFGAAKQNYLARHSRSRAPYTPGYAAYEQVSSEGDIGPWTDVYAVGALMWRMVAGGCAGDSRLLVSDGADDAESAEEWSSTPHAAEKRAYALHRRRPDPMVSAVELGADRFSPALLQAIDRCLTLYPEGRVQNCEELRKLLDVQTEPAHESRGYPMEPSDNAEHVGASSGRSARANEFSPGATLARKGSRHSAKAVSRSGVLKRARWALVTMSAFVVVTILLAARHGEETRPISMRSAPQAFLQAYYNAYRDQLPPDLDVETFINQIRHERPSLIEDMAEFMYNDQFAAHNIPREEFEERAGLVAWRDDQLTWLEIVFRDIGAGIFKWLAALGQVEAQFKLGVMYYEVQEDAQAIKWYIRAAERGHADAQLQLGRMYDNGEGVPQNHAQALQWYARAAEQGYGPAQYQLGNMYFNGEGVLLDYNQAVRWFTRAAEQGIPGAQISLGRMYAHGEGVQQDDVQAYAWANLASVDGLPDAVTLRDATAQRLSGAQLSEAQRLSYELEARIQNTR